MNLRHTYSNNVHKKIKVYFYDIQKYCTVYSIVVRVVKYKIIFQSQNNNVSKPMFI